MVCSRCGAENPDGSSFCNLCFARFVQGQPGGQATQPPASSPPSIDQAASLAGSAGSPAPVPPQSQAAPPQASQPAAPASPPAQSSPIFGQEAQNLDEMLMGEPAKEPTSEFEVMPPMPRPPGPFDSPHLLPRHNPGTAASGALASTFSRVADMHPESGDWWSLGSFAVGVGVAGAIFLRLASEFVGRWFMINKAISATTRQDVATTGHLSVTGVVLGLLLAVAVVGTLCYLVGYRSWSHGAILGGLTALVLCLMEGIVSLAGWGSLALYAKSTMSGNRAWLYFLVSAVFLVGVGAFAGWAGESIVNNREVGRWSFSKLATTVALSMCGILLVTATGALVKGAVSSSASASAIKSAFESMAKYDSWQATIFSDQSGQPPNATPVITVLYQKDKGYYISWVKYDSYHKRNSVDIYAVVPTGRYSLYAGFSQSEWRRQDDDMTTMNYDFFDQEKVGRMTIGKKSIVDFEGERCASYPIEGTGTDYTMGAGATVMGGTYDGDVLISEKTGQVVGFKFYPTPDQKTWYRVTFSRLGEPTLQNVSLP